MRAYKHKRAASVCISLHMCIDSITACGRPTYCEMIEAAKHESNLLRNMEIIIIKEKYLTLCNVCNVVSNTYQQFRLRIIGFGRHNNLELCIAVMGTRRGVATVCACPYWKIKIIVFAMGGDLFATFFSFGRAFFSMCGPFHSFFYGDNGGGGGSFFSMWKTFLRLPPCENFCGRS